MENSVNDRIRIMIKRENLTIETFANKINISKNTIVSMFNKGTKPSYEILSGIAIAYPNYSFRWILLGEENMLLNTESNNDDKIIPYFIYEELKEEKDRLINKIEVLTEQNGYYRGLLDNNAITYKQTAS